MKKQVCVEPPSDEGGGFCEAKDGGREQQKDATNVTILSLSFANAQQLPRQREPKHKALSRILGGP